MVLKSGFYPKGENNEMRENWNGSNNYSYQTYLLIWQLTHPKNMKEASS